MIDPNKKETVHLILSRTDRTSNILTKLFWMATRMVELADNKTARWTESIEKVQKIEMNKIVIEICKTNSHIIRTEFY